jgi:hypothetical protein
LTLKNADEIKDMKKTSVKELGKLYAKFTKVVQQLRRKDAEDWEVRTKRLRDQAELIKE